MESWDAKPEDYCSINDLCHGINTSRLYSLINRCSFCGDDTSNEYRELLDRNECNDFGLNLINNVKKHCNDGPGVVENKLFQRDNLDISNEKVFNHCLLYHLSFSQELNWMIEKKFEISSSFCALVF